MQMLRKIGSAIAVLVAVTITSLPGRVARADDAKVNTPVVIARLEDAWELVPDKPDAFRQKLRLGPGLTGTWQQGEGAMPTTIAWFVEGKELRILHYYEPKEPFNYRVKTLTFAYALDGDTLTLTGDGKPLRWTRVKAAGDATR